MKLFFFLPLLFLALTSQSSFAQTKKLLMLGDSLTEGLGVPRDAAYPALVEKKIKADGKNWQVINAGISGSTSASGPSRIKWQLKAKPDLVLLALGANDGLRGFKVKDMEKNLSQTIELVQKEKIPLILAGMMMPPNYGAEYRKDFEQAFKRVAAKYKVPMIPFILDGVAGLPNLNQTDGIHPNEKGHEIVADNVYKVLKSYL
jgi:acyl-CoA thioesterase-1